MERTHKEGKSRAEKLKGHPHTIKQNNLYKKKANTTTEG
jgi:hypothetical protein